MKNNAKSSAEVYTGGEITPEKLKKRGLHPYWERLSQIYSLIILAIFPLITETEGYSNTTYVKWIWFCVISCVYIAFCGFLFFNFTDAKIKRERLSEGVAPVTLPQAFIIAYMIWGTLSSLVSEYAVNLWGPESRYEGLASLLLYGLVFIMLSYWGEFSDKLVYAVAAMAFIMGMVCVLQMFGVNLYPVKDAELGLRYTYWETFFLGTLGNIDVLAGVTVMVVPFLAGSYIFIKKKLDWLWLPGFGLLLFVQGFSGVDSGRLGLLAALAVMLPFAVTTKNHLSRTLTVGAVATFSFALSKFLNFTPRIHSAGEDTSSVIYETKISMNSGDKLFILLAALTVVFIAGKFILASCVKNEFKTAPGKITKITFIALGVCVVAALVFLFFYTGTNTILSEIHEVLHGRLSDDAGSGRGRTWKISARLIAQHPVFGFGAGMFYTIFWPYNGSGGIFDLAHNDFIQVAFCSGIIGLLLYLGFVVTLAVRAFKATKKSKLAVIFIGACAGYLVHSFFSFSIAIVSPWFWVLAGMLDHLIRQLPTEAGEKTFKWSNLFGSCKKTFAKITNKNA